MKNKRQSSQMTWWVVQKRDGEVEYEIGPFDERERAERWIAQALVGNDVTLEIKEVP